MKFACNEESGEWFVFERTLEYLISGCRRKENV